MKRNPAAAALAAAFFGGIIEDSHNCWNLEPIATIQARKNAVELFDGLSYLTSVLEICEDESEEPVSTQSE